MWCVEIGNENKRNMRYNMNKKTTIGKRNMRQEMNKKGIKY